MPCVYVEDMAERYGIVVGLQAQPFDQAPATSNVYNTMQQHCGSYRLGSSHRAINGEGRRCALQGLPDAFPVPGFSAFSPSSSVAGAHGSPSAVQLTFRRTACSQSKLATWQSLLRVFSIRLNRLFRVDSCQPQQPRWRSTRWTRSRRRCRR